jgi:hypothetical protein
VVEVDGTEALVGPVVSGSLTCAAKDPTPKTKVAATAMITEIFR